MLRLQSCWLVCGEGWHEVLGSLFPCCMCGVIPRIPHLWPSFQECVVFCVREEPVLFLRVESDFVPYTPRGKENLHENLHSLQRRLRVEDLELTIRKEVIPMGWGRCWGLDRVLHLLACSSVSLGVQESIKSEAMRWGLGLFPTFGCLMEGFEADRCCMGPP